jgi:DNA-binding Lrp family transcriptional regulator
MRRLEAAGTIVGYSVRLRAQVEDLRIRALMTIAVEGNRIDAVMKVLRGDPAVATLHSTNGRWDIVAELRADTLESFDRVLARIRLVEGIAHSETSLLLTSFKL